MGSHRLAVTMMLGLLATAAAGCSMFASTTRDDIEQTLVGMTKSRLLECAGSPARSRATDGGEVLTYSGGSNWVAERGADDPTARHGGAAVSLRPDRQFCEASVVVEGKHVASVNLRESTGNILRRSREWMLRLGLGTDESHTRLQAAINELWGYTAELFECDALEAGLVEDGIAVNLPAIQPVWESQVRELLGSADIHIPEDNWQASGGRQGKHTEWLGYLLCELQFLQRAYPGLEW